MSHEIICDWLGLPPGSWPPDHYQLLGLEPGESDTALIERRVHERLDAVRCYQMMHPEPATEAMNRLAQAFVCLTEPAAKKEYDAALLAGAPVPTTALPPAPVGATGGRDPLAWLFHSPPPLPSPPVADDTADTAAAETKVISPTATPPPSRRSVAVEVERAREDPVLEAAQRSSPARRGLGTKRALYFRVVATRKLLRVWDQLGRFLFATGRRLSRGEGAELTRLLEEMHDLLKRFPPLLGRAGQPGYLVVALGQQEGVVRRFLTLEGSQREALSRDWDAGRKLLAAHRDFLRQEIRSARKRSFGNRLFKAAYTFATERPGAVLLALALLALGVALWRTYGP